VTAEGARLPLRLDAARERLRRSLWVLPTGAVLAAVVAGGLLSRVEVDPASPWVTVFFGGGAEGARGILQSVATAVVTVTSVSFTLTVVALQLAATQYSPRVLRNFLRDRGNQVVLSTFLATFAFALVALTSVRSSESPGGEFVPHVAVTFQLVLAFASIAALVYFIHHLTQSIRVEQVMREVTQEALACIGRNCDGQPASGEEAALPDVPDRAVQILATSSGYLQALRSAPLVREASERDVVFRYRRTVGEHVTEGTVIAWVWRREGGGELRETEELRRAGNGAVAFGAERTLQQDPALGIRQLVDIAVKAMSTGLNDPTTAVDTLGHLSEVLRALAARPLGAELHRDAAGLVRVALPRPSFADYLGIACAQVAHYSGGDAAVMRRLLRLLEDVGGVVGTQERRTAVLAEIDRAVAEAGHQLALESARESVRRAAEAAREAVAGRVPPRTTFTL
jgi:uncharacterized membrane protein